VWIPAAVCHVDSGRIVRVVMEHAGEIGSKGNDWLHVGLVFRFCDMSIRINISQLDIDGTMRIVLQSEPVVTKSEL
jgi:hypothetical protein